MIRLTQVTLPVGHTQEELKQKCLKLLKISSKDLKAFQIIKQSIDARKMPDIFYSYIIDIECGNEKKVFSACKCKQAELIQSQSYQFPALGNKSLKRPIVIIGMGPAGLFCGYMLAKHGYKPIILERGLDVDQRCEKVDRFWKTGVLDTNCNVQFGEGGAGTFSDGKLNTLIKDKTGRNSEVLSILIENGAPEQIRYDAKPHIGTDILSKIVKTMRERIIAWGGEVRFDCQVTGFLIEQGTLVSVKTHSGEEICCEAAVLAIGHSARDTFDVLFEAGVSMEAKPFAVGFRVEHPQSLINESQYGVKEHPVLGAAPYKVTAKTASGRGVYSFCMCPGGYVVNASSEAGRTAVNGMSYSGRDGANANSAIIVSVTPKDYGSDHPLAGVAFQRRIEETAFRLGQGKVPVELFGSFKKKVTGNETPHKLPDYVPCIKGKFTEADLTAILTEEMNGAFVEGMEHFDKILPGFAAANVWLSGVESRTSSPVRILRDEAAQSNIKGLYPCGEGAGYAGGITSAAMDGIKIAEQIASAYKPYL